MENKLTRNERRKLTATFINGIAIAAFATGGIAQAATLIQSGASPTLPLFIAICVVVGLALHWVARFSLRGMEE